MIGKTFNVSIVADIVNRDVSSLRKDFSALVKSGLIVADVDVPPLGKAEAKDTDVCRFVSRKY